MFGSLRRIGSFFKPGSLILTDPVESRGYRLAP